MLFVLARLFHYKGSCLPLSPGKFFFIFLFLISFSPFSLFFSSESLHDETLNCLVSGVSGILLYVLRVVLDLSPKLLIEFLYLSKFLFFKFIRTLSYS